MTHTALAHRIAALLALAATAALASCTAASKPWMDAEDGDARNGGLSSSLSVAAGADGQVSTLDVYDDGDPHPGVNAIDIAAPGESPVFYQLGDLTPEVAGGWLWIEPVRESGLCSQHAPDSEYYNGGKIYVTAFFYDTAGDYIGWHRAAYQHVVPSRGEGTWLSWNNAGAEKPAWPSVDVTLGDGPDGGVWLGSVFKVTKKIYNGPKGGLCTTGSHLHQEAEGSRASLTLWQEVGARKTALHTFDPSPKGTPFDAPAAPCGEVDFTGACDGNVAYYCRPEGTLGVVDCGALGLSCTWADLGDSPQGIYSCF